MVNGTAGFVVSEEDLTLEPEIVSVTQSFVCKVLLKGTAQR